MGVNNLPKIVAQHCSSGSQTRDLLIASQMHYPWHHHVTQEQYLTEFLRMLWKILP